MKTRNTVLLATLAAVLGTATLPGAEQEPIKLPAPRTTGGKPLLESVSQRKTTRELSSKPLPPQVLGDLLWTAFGINRNGTGHRTAPSAMNSQEIDLYVALPDALYLYDPKGHQLDPVLSGDFRGQTSGQDFAKGAAAVLVLVADFERMTRAKEDTKPFYSAIDAGCIVQNIYLFCASEGLGSVVYDLDRPPLSTSMKLRPPQRIVIAQAVGYPAVSQAK